MMASATMFTPGLTVFKFEMNVMTDKTVLVLLRHGETSGQSSIRYYGATDIPLSDLGREQMRRSKEALRDFDFKRVFVSPLDRSQESARLALEGVTNGLRHEIIEGFREIDFGIFEGLSEEEIADRYPDYHQRWLVERKLDAFPEGDSREGFVGRVQETALQVFGDSELPAIAVLHKGVIRGILSALLGIPNEELMGRSIEMGSIHVLERNGGGWRLVLANETDHLGDLRIAHS